jgi:hypothetical protein
MRRRASALAWSSADCGPSQPTAGRGGASDNVSGRVTKFSACPFESAFSEGFSLRVAGFVNRSMLVQVQPSALRLPESVAARLLGRQAVLKPAALGIGRRGWFGLGVGGHATEYPTAAGRWPVAGRESLARGMASVQGMFACDLVTCSRATGTGSTEWAKEPPTAKERPIRCDREATCDLTA